MVEIKAEGQEAVMRRVVIDGNAFYEVDEECERRKQEKLDRQRKQGKNGTAAKSNKLRSGHLVMSK